MPSILYSTGFSIVIIFLFIPFKSFNKEYTVVVFPLPVGPVTNNIPALLFIIRFIDFIASSEKPSSNLSFKKVSLLSILKTIFSP